MSFLQDVTALPGTTGFHGVISLGSPEKPIRDARSGGGFLAPLSQLLRHPARTINSVTEDVQNKAAARAFGKEDYENRRQILYHKLRIALTFEEWESAAIELDELEGNDIWKSDIESDEYNVALVQERLSQLDEARTNCDLKRMLFLIRTSLTRHLGGMGNLRLYKHSHIGTKQLIERYIESALQTIDKLLEISATQGKDGLDPKYLLEELLRSRQSFGRSALLLSGGGTFGMNHIGVLKSLFEASLLPRIISGASAGSIVAAVMCTKCDDQIPDVLESFCYGDLDVFEKQGNEDSVLTKVARFLKFGSLFDISHLERVLKDIFGDLTFQEAYNRTRRILNITVSSASLYELPRLLNYITAPNVIVWSAVCASCSVPFVFSAAPLLAKDPKTGEAASWDPSPQRWIDGSVDNDLPMTRLAEMFNVNHFIVSQVNPHVVPFLLKEEDAIAAQANQQSMTAFAAGPGWLHSVATLARSEALHRIHVLAELGIFPNALSKVRSVLSQTYSGDITILPEIPYAHFPRVLKNPTTDFMLQATLGGERATWPKLSRIQDHCAIELALDNAIQKLRARVAFSPSQVDLRMNAFAKHLLSREGSDSARNRVNGRERRIRDSRHHGTYPLGREERNVRLAPQQIVSSRALEFSDSNPTVNYAGLTNLMPTFSGNRPIAHTHFAPQVDTTSSSSPAPETDESETEFPSSSTDTPPSPEPRVWPHRRVLFTFASQPATPSTASHRKKGIGTPPPDTLGLATTRKVAPAMAPSAAETEYKKLFHTATGGGLSSFADAYPTPPEVPRRGRRSGAPQDLRIDISGTKGMMMRKKRSNSTGIRRLAPPTSR